MSTKGLLQNMFVRIAHRIRYLFPFALLVTTDFANANTSQEENNGTSIKKFCDKIDAKFEKLKWGESHCKDVPWKFDLRSEKGEPLVYYDTTDTHPTQPNNRHQDTTLLFSGVHSDELSCIYFGFRMAFEDYKAKKSTRSGKLVIVPLINPDGFFVSPTKRTNANGVDLNRNFPTRDWKNGALQLWRTKRRKNPSFYPGPHPGSEAETRFQAELIERYEPDKLISLHAPLEFIDYDGPGDQKKINVLSKDELKARQIALVLSSNSGKYRVIDFPFYPGSLGNYAGNERGIPTLTIEMSSKSPKKAESFWHKFYPAIEAAIAFEFKRDMFAHKGAAGKGQ